MRVSTLLVVPELMTLKTTQNSEEEFQVSYMIVQSLVLGEKIWNEIILYTTGSSAVAHSIYGVAQTINSANYVYFLALQKTAVLGHPRSVEIFTRELKVDMIL